MALFRTSNEEPTDRPVIGEVPEPTPRGGGGGGSGNGGDSVVAEGMVVRGDCEARGSLRVNGHVTGDVLAPRVSVGPTGRVDGSVSIPGGGHNKGEVRVDGRVAGSVHAERVEVGRDGVVGEGLQAAEAVVHGRVTGGIIADRRLMLEATAVVQGDIDTERLGIREEASIAGALRVGRPSGQGRKADAGMGAPAASATIGRDRAAGAGGPAKTAGGEKKEETPSGEKSGSAATGAATPDGKP